MNNYILPIVGVIGLATTTGFAISDTVKAYKKIGDRKLDTNKLVKEALPCYARTGVSFVITTGCIIGSAITGNRKMAKLAATNAAITAKYADLCYKVKERDPELYSEIEDISIKEYILDITGDTIRRSPMEIADAELQFIKEFYRQGCVPLKYYFDLLDIEMPNYYEDMGYSLHDMECIDIEYPIIRGDVRIVLPEPSADYRRFD